MKNLFSFWRLFLCVAISLSVVSCTDDKDDADDNRNNESAPSQKAPQEDYNYTNPFNYFFPFGY